MPKFTSAEVELLATDKTGPGIKSATNKIGGLSKIIKSYWAEVLVAVVAARQIYKVLNDVTQAYMEQEKAVTGMDAALRSTGVYTPKLSSELQNLATQLQGTTRYSDETIMSATGLLQSFGKLSDEALKKTVPIMLDLGERFGSVDTAAQLIGKTLGGTVNALGRYGLKIKEGATETERLNAVMAWAEKTAGGLSAAMGDTFAGKIERVKNIVSDYKEVIGRMLVEAGTPFMNWLLDFLNNAEQLQTVGKIVKGMGATFMTVFSALGMAIKYIDWQFKLFSGTIYTTQKIISVLFDPKRWGTGEIKKAFEDLKNYTVEMTDDMWQGWIKSGKRIGAAWDNTFKEMDLTITTTSSNVSYFTDSVDDMNDKVKETEEVFARIEDPIGAIAERQRECAEAAIGLGMQTIELNEAMMSGVVAYALYGAEVENTIEKIGALQEAFGSMYMTSQEISRYVAEEFTTSLIDGFDAVMTGAKDLKEAMKDMVASFLQALGKMYFTQFLANLFFRPAKAALALAASIAAYAGAAIVRSLQQGGFVTKQQGGMQYGDRVPAMLEPGEAVIPRRTVQRNAAAIAMMQTGGAIPITVPIYLDGREIARNTVNRVNRGQHTIDTRVVVNR